MFYDLGDSSPAAFHVLIQDDKASTEAVGVLDELAKIRVGLNWAQTLPNVFRPPNVQGIAVTNAACHDEAF